MRARVRGRRLLQGLMVTALGLGLVGCAETDPGVLKPETYLGGKDQRPTCPFPKVIGSPQMAGVTAHGLVPLQQWRPGYANKVNWSPKEPAGPLELTLRPVGKEEQVYRLEIPSAGPSLPALPGPGCWELTVKYGEKTESVGLVVEQDWIAGLGGLPAEPNHSATVQWSDPKGMRQLLQTLGRAKKEEVDVNRPWYPVFLVWELTGESFLRYYPAHQGEPALLQVEADLVTGNCKQAAQWLTVTLSKNLAATLEQKLELRAGELPERTGACQPFTNHT